MILGSLLVEEAERLLAERQLAPARLAFDRAEAAGADPNRCSGGRWMTAMLASDFTAAWRESDALRARNSPDPHRFWDGESLRGKRVVVRCLHGLGDAVQMLRYAPALAAEARSVVWEVPPAMLDVARCFAGVAEVVTWGDAAPAVVPVWDSQIEVMELPYIFRTTRESLPVASPYCRLPHAELERVRACMGGGCGGTGFVWAAGEWDPGRSMTLPELLPLLAPAAAHGPLWSLQGGHARLGAVELTRSLRDATDVCGGGLLALAATIANLDLLITVDTLAAHLAGALGTPAWLLLQERADWRWQAAGDATPWYPSLRLFRQQRQGEWGPLVERVRKEMA